MSDPERASAAAMFSWRRWALLLVGGMFVIALRTPGDWLHPTFYAEDGVIFFREQLLFGWHAVFHTYNGYYHLVPRLAALLGWFAPVRQQPLLFSVFNLGVQSLAVSLFFLPENRIFVRNDALRAAVCALALVDYQGSQMLNNVMDVQWFLLPAALMLLCHLGRKDLPLSRRRVAVYTVFMIFICLTAPLLLAAVPLALWALYRARGAERAVPLAMLAALLPQAYAFLHTPSESQNTAPLTWFSVAQPIVAAVGGWGYRCFFTITGGERVSVILASRGGELLPALALIAVLAVCFRAARERGGGWALRLAGVLAASVGLVGLSLAIRHLLSYFPDATHYFFFGGGARYFLISSWLLLVLAAMLVEHFGTRLSAASQAVVLLALFSLGSLSNYRVEELPDEGWARNAPAIEDWKHRFLRNEPRPHVNAPIYPPPWSVDLPAAP